MFQNASVFQRKKVIFNIDKNKSITNEFNFNTTILYIKIYIRDRLNLSNFILLYKSKPIRNNSLPLYKFFKDPNKKSIIFTIKPKNSQEQKENIKNKKMYEKEYNVVKETNNKLINNIKTYKNNNKVVIKENKILQRYKTLENLLISQNQEINKLKKEVDDANNRYIKLKVLKKLNYVKSNNYFSIISTIPKMPKSFSVESFNTMYITNAKNNNVCITNNTYYHTNNNINIAKEKNSFESIKDCSSIDNFSKINYNDTNNNIYINENSMINSVSAPITDRYNEDNYNNYNDILKDNEKFSRNEKAKNKVYHSNSSERDNSLVVYRYKMKEYNINNIRKIDENKSKKVVEESLATKEEKEEDKIDFQVIMKKFKLNNDINEKVKILINNIIDKNNINKCFISIFKYLNNNELINFSLTNKSSGVCSLYFLLNYFQNKIIYLNSNYSSLKSHYNELMTEFIKSESKSKILLSQNSKSGLRILNSPHYINIFNNPIEYFTKNKNCLFIYKILFQFTTIKFKLDDDNLFVKSMLEEIKTNTSTRKSFGYYLYNLIEKNLDFDFDNIVKCKILMKQYGINNIEGNVFDDLDRPSTIISYIVKDIILYTGLIKLSENKTKQFGVSIIKDKIKEENDINSNGLKNKILIVCEKIIDEIKKYENYYKKIEDIINKFYQ